MSIIISSIDRKEHIMKKNILITMGITLTLCLSGCQANTNNAETEALKEQITQLEQQITELQENQTPPENTEVTPPSADNTPTEETQATPEQPATSEQPTTQEPSAAEATPASEQTTPAPSTTQTMEELTSLVNAYADKVNAATPNASASDSMDQFFTLKQEEKQIDDMLDRHEDELEYLYKNNSLTREEYKKLERDLERLEDQLDDAEDQLEYLFGIDD